MVCVFDLECELQANFKIRFFLKLHTFQVLHKMLKIAKAYNSNELGNCAA